MDPTTEIPPLTRRYTQPADKRINARWYETFDLTAPNLDGSAQHPAIVGFGPAPAGTPIASSSDFLYGTPTPPIPARLYRHIAAAIAAFVLTALPLVIVAQVSFTKLQKVPPIPRQLIRGSIALFALTTASAMAAGTFLVARRRMSAAPLYRRFHHYSVGTEGVTIALRHSTTDEIKEIPFAQTRLVISPRYTLQQDGPLSDPAQPQLLETTWLIENEEAVTIRGFRQSKSDPWAYPFNQSAIDAYVESKLESTIETLQNGPVNFELTTGGSLSLSLDQIEITQGEQVVTIEGERLESIKLQLGTLTITAKEKPSIGLPVNTIIDFPVLQACLKAMDIAL